MGATGATISVAGCSAGEDSDESGGSADGGDSNNGDGNADSDGGDSDIKLVESDFEEQDFGVAVVGRAENTSGGELSYVEAEAVFLDSDGVQVGEGLDNVTDLAAGRVWQFECPYLGSSESEIARYEISVSTRL